jgi:glycosyltransferase involved in cell wall biosynthesis
MPQRVSLLIPTYARPQFLASAIAAILRSSHTDFELLVGDDGDQGAAVCAAAGDPRIVYHANTTRLGMAGNSNALLERSSGDLLALCMDDDRLDPHFVEKCVAVFDTHPDVDVVFSNHSVVRPDGSETVRSCPLRAGRHEDFAGDFLEHLPVAVSAAMFRRSAWESVRPLPPTAAADVVLFGRLAEAGAVFWYLDEPLMRYRSHDAMLSATEAFSEDCVVAWSGLVFSDPGAMHKRDLHLASALHWRGRRRLAGGRRRAARADFRLAAALAGTRFGLAGAAVRLVALVPGGGGVYRSARAWSRRLSVTTDDARDR